MKKIYIIGIVASGKTTLAKKMSEEMEIPYYELDCIVHAKTDNGRYKRTPEEQVDEIRRINGLGDWIIEGTYRQSCHCLLDMADEIIFLDPPLRTRRRRILTRFIKQKLRLEPCHYQPNLHMLRMMFQWTKDFERNRESFDEMLGAYASKLRRITTV